jgi:hypothetical protein
MSALQPFSPAYTQGQIVSATATAASVEIEKHARNVAVSNLNTQIAYVRIGTSGIAATTADFPILPGCQVIITKADGQGTLSYISAVGTSLHIIPGEGW